MKKSYFFGALMMLAGAAVPAQAQDVVTIKASDANQEGSGTIVLTGDVSGNNIQPLQSFEHEGIRFEFSMGEQTNKQQAPGWFAAVPDFRNYAKNTITITAPAGRFLQELEFTMTSNWYQYCEITADKGRMVSNGGDSDVKVADKKAPGLYFWQAENPLGETSVTLTVADKTFDDTKAGQFRFTAVDVTLSPEIDMESLYMGGAPAPSFEGEAVNLDEFPLGMAKLEIYMGMTLQKNPACEEPITIYWDDEPMAIIPASAGEDNGYTQAPYCRIDPINTEVAVPFGADDEFGDATVVDPMMPCTITLMIGEDPISLPGYYAIEIPDGYFLLNGCEVIGTMWFYEIEGSDDPNPPAPGFETFNDIVDGIEPSPDAPITPEIYEPGLQGISFYIDAADQPISVNKECQAKVVLYKADGEVLAEISSTDDIMTLEDEFKPSYMVNPLPSMGWPALVQFYFYPEANFQPGTYVLEIPKDFIQAGETMLDGASYSFTFVKGKSLGSFESLMYGSTPLPGSEINIEADSYYSRSGIDTFMYGIHGTKAFEKNPDCSEPVVITLDGAPYAEASVNATFTDNTPYVDVAPENMIPDTETASYATPSTVLLSMPVSAPIRQLGTYVVTIPDNFFRAGECTVEGSSFTYHVVDNTTAVETFKDEQSVTVFDANGIRVLDNAPVESLGSLEKGLYIVNGKKMIMK